MRTVSLTLRHAMSAAVTGEIMVVLLTIAHPALPAPIRVSSDPTQRLSIEPLQYGTISRGQTYLFLPFSVRLPDDASERAPTAQLVVDNVGRALVGLIRSTASPASVTVELVLASSPDIVEIEYPALALKSVSTTAQSMTLDLSIDALADEPFPSGTFNPSAFGGLF